MSALRASQPPVSDREAPAPAAAEARSHSAGDRAGESAAAKAPAARADGWRSAWQLPTIVVSGVLIVLGLRAAMKPPPPDDFDGALSQVDSLIATGEFEMAAERLREGIEPALPEAAPQQQGWFHALSADLTFASQQAAGVNEESNHRHIDRQYAEARELGFELGPRRLEWWGQALLAVEDLDGALKRLSELKPAESPASPSGTSAQAGHDAISDQLPAAPAPNDDDPSAAYGRLFRHIIDYSLARPEFSYGSLLERLAEYRAQAELDSEQQLWLAARMAELRLESEEPAAAIAGVLVDMRRLEGTRAEHDSGFGELYALLGRAHHMLGDDARALDYLKRALDMLGPAHPARGDALVLLAALDEGGGDVEAAFEKANTVVREFIGTRSFLPGLVARAQLYSVIGDHHASQADYREVAAQLAASKPRRDVTAAGVAASLADRFDAAIALGRLERALDYVAIAERLFDRDQVPVEVLLRLASGHRQLADNLLHEHAAASIESAPAADAATGAAHRAHSDPALRHEANGHYTTAADYYLRHAVAAGADPLGGDDAGDSLWAAASSFDHGGRQDRAIEFYQQYLDSHPSDDARRPETLFRLGQAHQARMEHALAAEHYQRTITEFPRSTFAARAHVPLAQCETALGRETQAIAVLEEVLTGGRLLNPDAAAYRDALIELGRLRHRRGEHTAAIERLTEAADRYPDDREALEVRYLLADSYRASALALDQRIAETPALSPADLAALTALRTEQLQAAEQLFGRICDEPAAAPGGLASHADLVRRAHLYRGDCTFELSRFAEAVELYEQAARRYSTEHGSMYALVQIVNCYNALGDRTRAAAAHHRALQRLKQLPDQAFAAPDALLDRAAWERWLRNNPVGPPLSANVMASEEP